MAKKGSREHKIFKDNLQEAVVAFKERVTSDIERGWSLCESPIEKIMLAELMFCDFGYSNPPHVVEAPNKGSINTTLTGASISPQYKEGKYRVDFGVFVSDFYGQVLKIAVECDGHDFHEKTKAQAARDKKRDRFLQTKGWRVLRFTGSEIYNNSSECAEEVSDLAYAWIDDAMKRAVKAWKG